MECSKGSHRNGWWALLAVGVLVLCWAPFGGAQATVADGPGSPAAVAGQEPLGRALFERHCSVCHGLQGAGDGRAAYLLRPAPRDFTAAKFRLVSTENGVPTQADLIATIKRGMPGSAMPPWEWLSEEDLWNLADYVRDLAVEGQASRLLAYAEEQEEELTVAQARELAEAKMQPGAQVEIGGLPTPDPVTLHEGQRLYMRLCASCHGEDGTGDSPVELWNEDGSPTAARDFTAGIFKGDSQASSIALRVLVGLPGSPMPQTPLDDPADAGILATYVRSLVKPGAEERVLQRRRTIQVGRVEGELPLEPDDPAWDEVEGAWVALMPLWWRDQRVEGVVVRGVHDGQRIAFRISWRDASAEDEILGQETFSDAAAIELSTQKDPPLFAMGEAGAPVDIAYWKAAWERDLAGVRDIDARFPNMPEDPFARALGNSTELGLTARQAGNPQSLAQRTTPAEDLVAQGFGTVGPPVPRTDAWKARGRCHECLWDVVFVRALETSTDEVDALAPGTHAFQAFAIWDGQARDRNGQKSVSVWHRLEIAR